METSIQEELITVPWLMQENEPSKWFNYFLMYYLPLGPGRTLTQAYIAYLKIEKPEIAEAKEASGRYINTTRNWSETARLWHWRERAEAFDRYNSVSNAQVVAKARAKLVESAEKAATALVENLTNPRLAVQAAKEILDRAGLPSAHIVGHANLTPYSADDFNKAQEEMKAWEEQLRGKVIDGTASDIEEEGSNGGGDSTGVAEV